MKLFIILFTGVFMCFLAGCKESAPGEGTLILTPGNQDTNGVPRVSSGSEAVEEIKEEIAEVVRDTAQEAAVSVDLLDSTNKIFLVDITPYQVTNIHGGLRIKKTYLREPIIINGTEYKHGMSTHAPGEGQGRVTYKLDKQYRMFNSRIAVTSHGKVTFEIFGDEKKLYRSKPVTQEDGCIDVIIGVRDVEYLTLSIDKEKHNFGDHAVWCDPVLIK
jgi:hypothetical protein